jgi:hypothetical protein
MVGKVSDRPPPHSQWGGSVAGASTGTGVLVLISLLDNQSSLRPILTYLSPSITVLTGILWAYTIRSIKDWVNDRRLRSERSKARNLVKQVEADQQASEQHKKRMRERSERLDLMMIDLNIERIQAIRSIDKL